MLAKFHDTHCNLQFYIVLLRFPFIFLVFAPCLFIMASKFALPACLFHPARLISLEKYPPACLFHPVRLLDR